MEENRKPDCGRCVCVCLLDDAKLSLRLVETRSVRRLPLCCKLFITLHVLLVLPVKSTAAACLTDLGAADTEGGVH